MPPDGNGFHSRARGTVCGRPGVGRTGAVKCKACHQIGANAHNTVGLELNGVIGRHSGSVEEYNYSEANKNSGLTWDAPTFREYIRNPRAKVPGTKMAFAGLSKQGDIDNIVAYLKQFGPDGEKRP